jgi:hypothetical protein
VASCATSLKHPGAPLAPLVCVSMASLLALALLAGCDGAQGPADEKRAATADWGEAQGRWHGHGWMEVAPEEERSLTPAQRREFARLRSLGYLPGSSPVPANTGVVVYDRRYTSDGLNFLTSGHAPVAILMDMAGNRLLQWRMSFEDAWAAEPGDNPPASIKSAGYWRRARLLQDGSVLAIFEGLGLIKVDPDSRLIWARFGGFHHDLDVTSDGSIYVLTRVPRIIPEMNEELPVLEDFISLLDAEGNELSRLSVLDAFAGTDYEELLSGMADHGDVMHTNTIEVLDGKLARRVEGPKEGDLLVCIRELGVIAVIDPESAKVVWAMAGGWVKPHQPAVLDNGDILIFDNRGNEGRSQVLEFDPATGDVVWSYRGREPDDFYSWECGSNQRLPNGNTLITESDRGKAFEVTPSGMIVWKYFNPMRAGKDLQFIATLFEVVRLPSDFPTGWLERNGEGRGSN